jgi:CelD/BcsL family acetyltransferase involved in cellulose biosynthesis
VKNRGVERQDERAGEASSPDRALRVAILEDTRSFAELEEEWEELYRNSPSATPFQSWPWLYCWWEFRGEGYDLRLVTVRNGEGLLVGIIPLMLKRGWALRRLLFVGTGPSGLLDMLVREGWEDAVFEVGSAALERMTDWDVADLQEVRPAAAIWGIFRRWDRSRVCRVQSNCPMIETKPWDELLAPLSKNLRSTFRRALRRAESEGVRNRIAEVAEAEEAARRLVALSREMWQERWQQTAPGHWSWRNQAYKVSAARRMAAHGLGGISEFWQDGEVILSYFWLSDRGFFGGYMLGAGRKALQRYQWSTLYIWDAVNIARSRNISHFNLLRGTESYKLRWNPTVVPNHRLILSRSLALWLPYAGYHVLRSKAQQYVDSDSAPAWAKRAYSELRALVRYGILRYLGLRERP